MKGLLIIWGAILIIGILGYSWVNSQINAMVVKQEGTAQLEAVFQEPNACLQNCSPVRLQE